MENREYWSGTKIDKLEENEVFVFGSNPQGINGAGAAKAAMSLSKGAKNGIGRGFNGSNAYALVTKSLNAGFLEKSTGILYDKEGYCSVSPEQIRANIDELYEIAKSPEHKNKKFLVSYQYESWPNGTPKKSLNGYTSQEMLEMFVREDIPENIVFHESYKSHLEKLLINNNKNMTTQNSNEVNYENYTFFFQQSSPFSQWHPSLFKYKGYDFICAEQFMMFSKAKTFRDEAVAQRIMNLELNFPKKSNGDYLNQEDELRVRLIQNFKDGKMTREEIINNNTYSRYWKEIQAIIKKLGREVSNYNDNIWKEKRAKVVSVGSREKYAQNPDLKTILMNTGDTIMVEASPFDKIWGIGLNARDAVKVHPSKWPGLNLLGGVLTDLKAYFRNEPTPTSRVKP